MGDRTNLTELNSIKDVPPGEIFAKSEDGKVIVTKDGTKVSDVLISEAKAQKKAEAKAAAAAAGQGPLDDAAREAIIEEAKAAGVRAAREEFQRLSKK